MTWRYRKASWCQKVGQRSSQNCYAMQALILLVGPQQLLCESSALLRLHNCRCEPCDVFIAGIFVFRSFWVHAVTKNQLAKAVSADLSNLWGAPSILYLTQGPQIQTGHSEVAFEAGTLEVNAAGLSEVKASASGGAWSLFFSHSWNVFKLAKGQGDLLGRAVGLERREVCAARSLWPLEVRGEWVGLWREARRPSLHHTKWRQRSGKLSRPGQWRTWLAVLCQRVGPGHEQPIGSARLLTPIRTWLPCNHGSAVLHFHNFPLSTPTPLLPPCLFTILSCSLSSS